MGRKAIKKDRKDNASVLEKWAKSLLPILLEQGLQDLTSDRLAKLIGCSKATVYAYLTSKDELIMAVLGIKLKEVSAVLLVLEQAEQPFAERCEAALQQLATVLSGITPLFLTDLKKLYPSVWSHLENFIEQVQQALMDFYREGIDQGAFQQFRPEILWLTDRALLNALIQPETLEKHNLTLQKAFDDFIRLKFYGLLPRDTPRGKEDRS